MGSSFRNSFAALAVIAAGFSTTAKAEILNFDDLPVPTGTVSNSYGDTATVDITYTGYFASSGYQNAPSDGSAGVARYYSTVGYGACLQSLGNVLYISGRTVADMNERAMEITFDPAAGYGVKLSAFDLASWTGTGTRNTHIDILDLATSEVLFSTGDLTFGVPELHSYTVVEMGEVYSDNGLRLLFGPNAHYNGIDNIAFSSYVIGEMETGSEIPLPGAMPLIAIGLGITAVQRRA